MNPIAKSMALLYFLLLLPIGCSVHIQKPIPGIEKKIEVKEGAFLFQDLKVVLPSYSFVPDISGSVTNRTNKDWKNVNFEVLVEDQTGELQKDQITVRLPKGDLFKKDTKRELLNIIWGKSLYQIKTKDSNFQTKKLDIRFLSGGYPASYTIKLINSTHPNSLSFEDNNIDIQFTVFEDQIGFVFNNKTDAPIKVDWDQASYVDIKGQSHKVIHSGIRLIDRDKPQSTTMIPPSAKINDLLIPSDHIYYEEVLIPGWRHKPLLPDAPLALEAKGKSFSVFLPIEVNGKVKNYLFKFSIEDVMT